MPMTAEVTVGSAWPIYFSRAIEILNDRVTPILGTSPRNVLFGSVDDAMDLNQIVDLDLDVGLHFKFLDAECDDTLDHFTVRQVRRKLYFDKRAKEKIFKKDDLVLVHNSRYFNAQNREVKLKLSPPWFGPLIVHERIHNSYILKTMAGNIAVGRVHVNRLKKFHLAQDTVEEREIHENAINEDQAILDAIQEIRDPPIGQFEPQVALWLLHKLSIDDPPDEHIQPIHISLPTFSTETHIATETKTIASSGCPACDYSPQRKIRITQASIAPIHNLDEPPAPPQDRRAGGSVIVTFVTLRDISIPRQWSDPSLPMDEAAWWLPMLATGIQRSSDIPLRLSMVLATDWLAAPQFVVSLDAFDVVDDALLLHAL
ncbi:hypothetical protein M422DRAFT_254120 [Sphaerobolus stellatus SS14]|uniref:Uncharacterized protein n=1 Tax=Sphaerobolus stellatus (strain SS14) TaxID=990650 RepID=A0A0C9VVJ8_SPHS4|nr:hypothetical protein M422DRAFT_254120 [Sphaerobolus stellatus SS14]